MSDRKLGVFFGTVVFLIFSLAVYVVLDSRTEDGAVQVGSNQETNHAVESKKGADETSLEFVEQKPSFHEEDKPKAEEDTAEFWPTLFGYRLKITDSLLVLFTALLAWKTRGLDESTRKLWNAARIQADDMKKSIAASERSADVSERALVELEAPFISTCIVETGLTRRFNAIGHDFGMLKFNIINYGRTPASLVEIVDKTKFVTICSGQPQEIDLEFRSRNTIPRGVISPPMSQSQNFTRTFLVDHMDEISSDDHILKTKAFFFYGFVRYRTIFNDTFRMGFCFIFDRFSEKWILAGDDKLNYLAKEE